MEIPYYVVNAFSCGLFTGNPASVCPLQEWLPDKTLQEIAFQNNLAETAYFIQKKGSCSIRWFTPLTEVELCGHATLASAAILFHELNYSGKEVIFQSKSGELRVFRKADQFILDFPSYVPESCSVPEDLLRGLGEKPSLVLRAKNYFVIYETEEMICSLSPKMDFLSRLGNNGVIVTAPGNNSDFVSRYFAPQFGIAEDHVTGSAHCSLVPYWAKRLKKQNLHAFQRSARGGELFCSQKKDRVFVGGRASLFQKGIIIV